MTTHTPAAEAHATARTALAAIADELDHPRVEHGGPAQSLLDGAAGTALLHVERARTGDASWSTVDAWLHAATRRQVYSGPGACLALGAPALSYVVGHAARHCPDPQHRDTYLKALKSLDDQTDKITRHRLEAAHRRIDRRAHPALAEFDLLHGLTGLGSLYLHHRPDHPLIHDILSYLVRLTEPADRNCPHCHQKWVDSVYRQEDPQYARRTVEWINRETANDNPDTRHTGNTFRPGWWCAHGPQRQPVAEYPTSGHANNGIAHGIAGPLALLSLALLHGITVAGQRQAISSICAWFDTVQCRNGWGPWWPRIITDRWPQQRQTTPSQPSWCYGTPGIARALRLAARATDDTDRRDQCDAALLGCLSDRTQRALITEPHLCHGWAGLLTTTLRTIGDEPGPFYRDRIDQHLQPLLIATAANAARAHHTTPDTGLLTGRTGVALALHSALHPEPNPDQTIHDGSAPTWDACLMLT